MEGGMSSGGIARTIETLALIVVGVAVVLSLVAFIGVRMAGWTDPESEDEFERMVERSERLAAAGTAAEPDESEFMALDPLDDGDFEELVRDALDDLPDLLRQALDRNVAVVISDRGRRHRAYGLYM